MAKPYQKRGTWYARVKDEAGRWRSVALQAAADRLSAEFGAKGAAALAKSPPG